MTDIAPEDFMRRAIALARPRVGLTGDNPAVGCVLVSDGVIVGEGVTGEGGRPHAEEQALDMAGPRAAGAAAYVTLEPCGERSSGAVSCADRMIVAGVARIFVACADPSEKASGRGVEALSLSGATVQAGMLESEAASLYGAYFSRRP